MSNTSKGRDTQGGSKDWMQTIINSDMSLSLDNDIGEGRIKWLSPLAADDYQEYRLNQSPISELLYIDKNTFSKWWPSPRQPQWDAIGTTDRDAIILVEAKAHLNETKNRSMAKAHSYELIKNALKKTHSSMSANTAFNEEVWMKKYYQTANRLLFWDNMQLKYKTILVFLNFIKVPTPRFQTSKEEWNNHTKKIFEALLGYGVSALPNGIKVIDFEISPFYK